MLRNLILYSSSICAILATSISHASSFVIEMKVREFSCIYEHRASYRKVQISPPIVDPSECPDVPFSNYDPARAASANAKGSSPKFAVSINTLDCIVAEIKNSLEDWNGLDPETRVALSVTC